MRRFNVPTVEVLALSVLVARSRRHTTTGAADQQFQRWSVARLDFNRCKDFGLTRLLEVVYDPAPCGGRRAPQKLNPQGVTRMRATRMRTYPLRVVEAMVADGCSLESIEDFIEGRTELSEEVRSALWLLAWSETSGENRRQRVAELMSGERQLAGRVSTNGRVDCSGADESMAGPNELAGMGASAGAAEGGSGPVSFKRSIGVDARVEGLAANELELLADKSLGLADRYERAAAFMEDEEGRQTALALSNWRRRRGQHFRELSADAERREAEHLEWARARLRMSSSNPPDAA